MMSYGSRLIWGCAKLLPSLGVEEAELQVALGPGAECEDGMFQAGSSAQTPPSIFGPSVRKVSQFLQE